MNTLEDNVSEDAQLLQAQAQIHNFTYAYVDTMALKAAVELRIADIIESHGKPMSLSHIASQIDSPSLNVTCLARVMRLLALKNIFTVDYNQSSDEEPLYGLTHASRYLVHGHELSLAPMLLTFASPSIIASWNELGRFIKEGGSRTPFEKLYGQTFYERASQDIEFNHTFNAGMASYTKHQLSAILGGYNDGFSKIQGTMVDLGGGVGWAVSKIVEAHPQIRGINFDLPHVVATAPKYPGVTHVGGDMFKEIPTADVIFIKEVLLDWCDEDCIKILKNCQKALFEKKGKVIIVDTGTVQPNGKGLYDEINLHVDLLLMACFGGKARTENEWNKLLKEAGFARYNIITISHSTSIIEAYLQ